MRLGIIGIGSIGTRHLQNALALGCDVVVTDTDQSRVVEACAVYGVQPWVKDDQPDAAIIATPYDTHLHHAQECAAAGVPFLVEKPLGSLDQIDAWRDLVANTSGLVTQIGYQCRWHSAAQILKRMGPLRSDYSCECDMCLWPGAAKHGVPVLECSHEIDLAMWLGGGRLTSATVSAHLARLVFERASVNLAWHREYYRREWSGSADGSTYRWACDSVEELGDQMYVEELRHFLACVQTGQQTDAPIADGLRVLEVCAEAMA